MYVRSFLVGVVSLTAGIIPSALLTAAPSNRPMSSEQQSVVEPAVSLDGVHSSSAVRPAVNGPFNSGEFARSSAFVPAAAAPIVPTGSATARTSHEMLMILAQSIQTTGMMTVKSKPTLVIKANGRQIFAKIGDTIPVPFEGTEHTVTITAIDRESFTIEWNGEKATRPIRSSK